MANPRKFSEKIALHNQKQAEETAAFEQIMREVSDATSKSDGCGDGGGGCLQNALSNLEEIKCGHADTPIAYRERGRSVGVGPVRSRAADKRIDTSPYSSGAYLSPPPDTSCRRTYSDSALHQSALDQSQRRVAEGQLRGMNIEQVDSHKQLVNASDGRPRSCCDGHVPGINIYPSQHEPGTVQIPIGNNTGSLPDLTSFQFSSPLNTPLDQDSSSPYSSSPQGASPATLSPTSVSSRPGRFSFGGSSPPQEGPSPGHSPSARRRHYPHWHTSPQSPAQLQNHLSVPSLMNARYLHTCKGMALDKSGNIQLENLQQNHYVYQQPDQQSQLAQQQVQQLQQQVQQQVQQQHRHLQQQQQVQCNPALMSSPQNIPAVNTHHVNSLSSYRNPHHPSSRPSPQTSPSLVVQGALYRSGSPGDTSHSGPQSPVSPASSPGIGSNSNPFADHNSYYLNQEHANMLQQHFEQFSMMDHPVSTSINYIDSPSNTSQYSQAVSGGSPEECLKQELGADPGYFSQLPSQQQYTRPGSTQPQTPNTPSSIPDIILTDFSSSTADELSRQEFVKDLNSAMSGSFDSDLFPSDDTLREGLDPIDFDGLQMLTDPDINSITDPATEDSFRLDRL